MNKNSFILRCTQCGTKNRVPAARIKDNPVCGKCRTKLPQIPAYSSPVHVTDRNFQDEVLAFPGPVLVDFWASWCGPCQMMSPILDQLAREYSGRLKIVKLNLDQNPMTASQYNVLSVPTLLFFKNGKVVNNLAGAVQKEQIEYLLGGIL